MNNKNKIIQKLAMPSAAKLIEEKKIDINTINGTGVDGRVTKGDVLLHLNLIKNHKLEEETSKPQKNILTGKENSMDVIVPVLGESVAEEIMNENNLTSKFDYKKFNIKRFGDDYMKEFWNLVQGEENTLHRQGKNTL